MLVEIGLRWVDIKDDTAQKDPEAWQRAKEKQEEDWSHISLQGFTSDCVAIPSQRLGECVGPLHRWLLRLLCTDDATPMWLRSYQLYAHYKTATGSVGFRYDRPSRFVAGCLNFSLGEGV